MKWVNIEHGIITDGFEFDGAMEPPHIKTIENDGKSRILDMVVIDDLMIEPIILLNKKGYRTEWCCSGHLHENCSAGYIRFTDSIFKYDYVLRPNKDIDLDTNEYILVDDCKTIRANICEENMTTKEIVDSIIGFNTNVLKWAIALPNKKE